MDVRKNNGDVMTWKGFPHYWPFVGGIERWPMDSFHKWQVMWTFDIFLLASVWTNCWKHNRRACELRHIDAHLTSLRWAMNSFVTLKWNTRVITSDLYHLNGLWKYPNRWIIHAKSSTWCSEHGCLQAAQIWENGIYELGMLLSLFHRHSLHSFHDT